MRSISNRLADEPEERKVAQYEKDIKSALASFRERTHFDPAARKVSLGELMGSMDGSLEEWGITQHSIRRFLIYCTRGGTRPAEVIRTFYAIACHMAVEPFCLLTTRERGLLLGESHGAAHWRTKKFAEDPCRRNGAKSYRAPGAKRGMAAAESSKAQKGNSNRRRK
jgi:hypothetical protein